MDTNAEKISNMEVEIMKAIWSKGGPITYTEIRTIINETFEWESQVIHTMVKRLVGKGVLKQEKREVYYYSALVSEADYIKSKTMTLVEKVFDGDAKGLLSALLSYKEVSTEDLEDLQKFWKKGRGLDE